jgi:hypothetical protein
MRRSNVSAGPVPTSNLATRSTKPTRTKVVPEILPQEVVVNKKIESKRISHDIAHNKSYKFKNPKTGEPVLIRAESFNLALKSFREMIKEL